MNQQTDLSKKLRAHVSGHAGLATNTDNKLLLDAADEIEHYYTGMLKWKHTAEAKDAIASQAPRQALTDAEIMELVAVNFNRTVRGDWIADRGEILHFARAITSQAPRQALTDAEIAAIYKRTFESAPGCARSAPTPAPLVIAFGHAVAAASGPNAALVEALKGILNLPRGTSGRIILDRGDELTVRAALAAVGEEV